MFRRIFVPVLLNLALIFLSLTIVAAQNVAPPSQPLTGPGGKQYVQRQSRKIVTARAGRNTGFLSLTRPGRGPRPSSFFCMAGVA